MVYYACKFGKPNLNKANINEGGDEMPYNYAKLLGRIKERGYTQAKIAEKIGRNEGSVSAKLNGKSVFTTREIDAICEALDIPNNEIADYFFAK